MLHILSLLFWLVIVPGCMGFIPANFISAKKRHPGFVLLAGYFVMWALFEVVAIPAVLFVKYNNFKAASVCFTVLGILCAGAGLWLVFRNWRMNRPGLMFGSSGWDDNIDDIGVNLVKRLLERGVRHVVKMSWAERIEWLLFFILLVFQLYKAEAYASFDGDDAYYVVESLIAQQADVMYRILPYTGRPTDLDIRHALAVFPMWIAFVAKRSGIHATIVSHSVMPLVLIPLGYLVYYEAGRVLFGIGVKRRIRRRRRGAPQGKMDRKTREAIEADSVFYKENLPAFMVLMALFQIFGNVSIYTNETFFLTRTWQGKAVAGSLVIPALFWMFLWIYGSAGKRRRPEAGMWLVFVCVNMTAGVCSSIAVFLASILIAVTALCLAVVERDYRVLLKMGAVCIPNVIYMAIYVIVGYSYLLR